MRSLDFPDTKERNEFLTEQLITYIGNKRALLGFINQGMTLLRQQTGKRKFSTFDVFSGSGIVSRLLKQYSSRQYANDMEDYSRIINTCYLSNECDVDLPALEKWHKKVTAACRKRSRDFLTADGRAFLGGRTPGFISEFYAPLDMDNIQSGERCFYTPYNACTIDLLRQCIQELVPEQMQPYLIAPLLSQASIHANTGGVFKGFYKNSRTGIGKFGGNGENALSRIQGAICLPLPVFSKYKSKATILQTEANLLASSDQNPKVDIAYIDPPYNQHPYSSNYFMLNLIAGYKRPDPAIMSKVSGIPKDWNRSCYNKKRIAKETFTDLVQHLNARHLMVSFNNEGFIPQEDMLSILKQVGKVTVLESAYNTYRASRNLKAREIHTTEYLYIVET